MIKAKPLIFCGSSGTRLWALSRSGFPKQFLCLAGKESLFQEATKRMRGLVSEDPMSARLLLSPMKNVDFWRSSAQVAMEDLRAAERDSLISDRGHKAMNHHE